MKRDYDDEDYGLMWRSIDNEWDYESDDEEEFDEEEWIEEQQMMSEERQKFIRDYESISEDVFDEEGNYLTCLAPGCYEEDDPHEIRFFPGIGYKCPWCETVYSREDIFGDYGLEAMKRCTTCEKNFPSCRDTCKWWLKRRKK